nr:helix-turn-helix transcriptional regulator [Actinomycetales bacterium]
MNEFTPRFLISVAAELAGMHPQTLREYDRLGIVSPARTVGRGRRYSLHDVELLREVQRLSQEEGVNLSGIKRIMRLERALERALAEVERLQLIAEPGHHRVFSADRRGDVVVTRS